MRRGESLFVLLLILAALPASPQVPPSDLCGEAFAKLARASHLSSPLRAHFRHALTAPALNQTVIAW